MTTDSDGATPQAIADWLTARADHAAVANHRALVVLAGPRDWGRACAEAALAGRNEPPILWVSDTAPADAWSLAGPRARQVLGQETAHVVFDAFAGFNPDALGAIAGTIRAGGLLLLLTPPLQDWPEYPDPEYARITVDPYPPEQLAGRFLRRLVQRLGADTGAEVIEAHRPLPVLPTAARSAAAAPATTPNESTARTPDQAAAVAAIEKVAHGRPRRPVALVADRGRGKSAALGLAAARLLGGGNGRIIVTAPRRQAVAPVFDHAAEQLPDARHRGSDLVLGTASLGFMAPDQLLDDQPDADLVLVDEAAALPGPLLEQLLRTYPRIGFATTLHGYEGSGRGFAVRFERLLDRVTPHWRRLALTTPIRWAPGDPLEAFVFDALLLDAEPLSGEDIADITPTRATIEAIDRDRLTGDEKTLRQLLGLLAQAHYRTTPGDLRNILDGPNYRLWLARHGSRVIGACLAADEGPLATALGEAVARGERRVHGHLLPQTLAFHGGAPEATALRARRVVRIAILPRLQAQGLGSQLLRHVHDCTKAEGFDYWGTAFGATSPLIRFWAAAGMVPARLGVTREASSAQHSAVMLQGLSPPGQALATRVRRHFAAEWPLRVAEFFTDLSPDLVQTLTAAAGPPDPPWPFSTDERALVDAFIGGGQSYENAAVAVWKATLAALAHGQGPDTSNERAVLIAKVMQKRSWAQAARAGGCDGQREVRAALQRALGALNRDGYARGLRERSP